MLVGPDGNGIGIERREPPSFGTWRRRFLGGLPGEDATDYAADASNNKHAKKFSHLIPIPESLGYYLPPRLGLSKTPSAQATAPDEALPLRDLPHF